MFSRILKKDLLRKKTMNVVLLLLITLCTTFMAASVGNLTTLSGALDHFAKVSNMADYYLFGVDAPGASSNEIDDWITSADTVSDYEKQIFIPVRDTEVSHDGVNVETNSKSLSLATLPKTYNLVFEENESLNLIEDGAIAITSSVAFKNDLEIGDTIEIEVGNEAYSFTVEHITQDMLFGSDYFGFNRAFVSAADYDELFNEYEGIYEVSYSIKTPNIEDLVRDKNTLNLPVAYEVDAEMVRNAYVLDMMVFAIMIIASFLLILIALVLLRFTMSFTLQEDLREIGAMKALGVPTSLIKKVYAAKYLFLACIGSALGVAVSIPFGKLLLAPIERNIVFGQTQLQIWTNIACALFVIALVALFTWLSARRIDKLSAVQALRSGASGERFKRKSPLKLSRSKKLSAVSFMSLNDILSGLKNYSVLIVAFAIGVMLVIVPSNAITTLQSEAIAPYLGVSNGDVIIDTKETIDYSGDGGTSRLVKEVERLEQQGRSQGLALDMYPILMMNGSMYVSDIDLASQVYFSAAPGDTESLLAGMVGTAPRLANEIAVTTVTLERLSLKIGDEVHAVIGGEDEKYLITCSYESMSNMGNGAVIPTEKFEAMQFLPSIDNLMIAGKFESRQDVPAQVEQLKEIFPSFSIDTAKGHAQGSLGAVVDTIKDLKSLILVVVLFVICLIAGLLAKILLSRDYGEVALLKGIGFSSASLMRWQVMRMAIVLLLSAILGIVLSLPGDMIMVHFTFGTMGATGVALTINPFEVYLLYPVGLLIGALITILLASMSVKRINIRALSEIE